MQLSVIAAGRNQRSTAINIAVSRTFLRW